jgi:transposase
MRQRGDLLASTRCLAGCQGVVEDASGHPQAIAFIRDSESLPGYRRQHERAGGKRGQLTGPNPTDRGKRGSKHHLLVDSGGIPLVVGLSGANVPDVLTLPHLVINIPHVAGKRGRPAHKPDRLHADKGYASKKNRQFLAALGVKCRIARKGIESKEHLGRRRWVVERTIAWFHRFKRLRTRYERHAETHMAFMILAAALICWRQLTGKRL